MVMNTLPKSALDWVDDTRANVVAWWVPKCAIFVAMLAPAPVRAAVWITALIWMGAACFLNAHRCGRTHCRYTGPFYLAMIVPVILLATDIVSTSFRGWLGLAVFILLGGWIIWWATERGWGKYLRR
jgi:hypothetical protein